MIFDIVVFSALLISALVAFMRGFIKEVLTIAGVLGGFVAALYFGPVLSDILSGWLGAENGENGGTLFGVIPYSLLTEAAGYGVVFISVVIILSVASHFIAKGASAVGLGPVDRTLGVVFGLARAIILLGLLYMPVHLLVEDEQKEEWFGTPVTEQAVAWTSEKLIAVMPERFEIDAQDAETQNRKAQDLMESLDILKGGEDKSDPSPESDNEESTGYPSKDREKLDELFESGTLNE